MDTEDGADSGSSSGGNMTTVSQHTFGDKFDKPAFTISIIEALLFIFHSRERKNQNSSSQNVDNEFRFFFFFPVLN